MTAFLGIFIVAVAFVGCGGSESSGSSSDAADPAEIGTSRAKLTRHGYFFVRHAPKPDPIPVGETFELTVEIYDLRDIESREDASDLAEKLKTTEAKLTVEARQAGGGTAMDVEPSVESTDKGAYTVRGMKFDAKASGDSMWVIEMAVELEQTSDTVLFGVEPE